MHLWHNKTMKRISTAAVLATLALLYFFNHQAWAWILAGVAVAFWIGVRWAAGKPIEMKDKNQEI